MDEKTFRDMYQALDENQRKLLCIFSTSLVGWQLLRERLNKELEGSPSEGFSQGIRRALELMDEVE